MNLNNDIALLITPLDITFTHWVKAVDIPKYSHELSNSYVGYEATVSGWGRTADGKTPVSDELRSAENRIISNALCAATYGDTIIPSTLCLSSVNGRGSCVGDSGGPLTLSFGYPNLLVGVVSFNSEVGCHFEHPAG